MFAQQHTANGIGTNGNGKQPNDFDSANEVNGTEGTNEELTK